MAYDLDMNSDFTKIFVQNIDDENEITIEKKVNQSEKEMTVFTIRETKNHWIKSGKSCSAIIKTKYRGKRLRKRDIYLQMMFLQLIQKEYFMLK